MINFVNIMITIKLCLALLLLKSDYFRQFLVHIHPSCFKNKCVMFVFVYSVLLLQARIGFSVGLVFEVDWQCLDADTGIHKLSDRRIQHQPELCPCCSH